MWLPSMFNLRKNIFQLADKSKNNGNNRAVT